MPALRRNNGRCLVQAPGVSVRLDIEGRYVETRQEDFAPAGGSIQFRNKMFKIRRRGTWKVDAAREEPK